MAFNNFLIRLKWHCHFIQKFEVECSYENKCINADVNGSYNILRKAISNAFADGIEGFAVNPIKLYV